jgi:hypothetical protein
VSVDVDAFVAASRNGTVHIKEIARDLIPEDPEAKLEDAHIIGGDKLVLSYQRNVNSLCSC